MLVAWPRCDAKQIAYLIYKLHGNADPTRLQMDTVNQAMRSLVKRGLVERHPGMTWRGLPSWEVVGPVQTQKRLKRASKKREFSVIESVK